MPHQVYFNLALGIMIVSIISYLVAEEIQNLKFQYLLVVSILRIICRYKKLCNLPSYKFKTPNQLYLLW